MKSFCIVFMMILSGVAFAQKKDISEKNVPQQVFQNFVSKYPEAKTRTWKTKNGDYEVDFYISLKKYEAKYEASGQWKKTSVKINKKDVPELVHKSFQASEYSGWTLDDAYSVEDTENKNMYMLKVIKGSNIMELLYKSDGQLLKAKNKTES